MPGITGRLLLCLAFVCVGDRSGELWSSLLYDRDPLNNLPRHFSFKFMYMYVCMCASEDLFAAHVPNALRDQSASDPLELKLQAVGDHLMRVLGIKSRSLNELYSLNC